MEDLPFAMIRALAHIARNGILCQLIEYVHYAGENKYGLVKFGIPIKNGVLGVGELFVAAVVAAVVDEFLGGVEVVLR